MSEPDAAPRVAYVSLGCRTNRAETDGIAAELRGRGCVLCDERDADAIVINTCAVTGEAEAKARKAVRHAWALPQAPAVVATGCVATLFAESLAAAAPGAVVEPDKERVVARVLQALGSRGATPGVGAPRPSVTPTGRTRPGIKVQDGCDLRCSYCIVWKARGPARSVPSARVLGAVREAVDAGASEVVLTGINVGSYRDAEAGDLAGLLRAVLAETSVGRVRLSSVEPPDVTGGLLATMAGADGRIAPFLHVCLQSGCDETLARMGRGYRADAFREVVASARATVPGIALGTDVIVGFPGETAGEFEESLSLCRDMGFSRMHVFRYSRRPGTPAARMAGQVDPRVAADRSGRMRALARELRRASAASQVGSDQLVCVQAPGRAVTGTLFDALVDPSLPVGALLWVRVRGVCGDADVLDARP